MSLDTERVYKVICDLVDKKPASSKEKKVGIDSLMIVLKTTEEELMPILHELDFENKIVVTSPHKPTNNHVLSRYGTVWLKK